MQDYQGRRVSASQDPGGIVLEHLVPANVVTTSSHHERVQRQVNWMNGWAHGTRPHVDARLQHIDNTRPPGIDQFHTVESEVAWCDQPTILGPANQVLGLIDQATIRDTMTKLVGLESVGWSPIG